MKQGDIFLSYFSKDPEVVSMGKLYLPWIIAMPVITFGGFLLDGLFLGLSKTTSMFKSVVYGVIFCFLPLKLIFDPLLGLHSLWLALLAFTFFRFVWLVKEYRTLAIKA
jgi:MATE family multidrug resistance protein